MKIREFDMTVYHNLEAQRLHAKRWPPWLFDEIKACGGHDTWLRARTFDASHERFRDFEKETQAILEQLELTDGDTVLDAGCGTGAFCLHAASHVKEIHAVDISKAMIRVARCKARKLGLTNVHFGQGSLLTYEHKARSVDAVVCSVVLHHLPDFWKLVALMRLRAALKPGGQLYLFDVVYSFEPSQYRQHIPQWLQGLSKKSWTLSEQAFGHVKEEYSTCHWIMEGLLERAGFTVTQTEYPTDFTAIYVAKAADSD